MATKTQIIPLLTKLTISNEIGFHPGRPCNQLRANQYSSAVIYSEVLKYWPFMKFKRMSWIMIRYFN
jgi:hypothetical protein